MDKFALQDRFAIFTYTFMGLMAAALIGWPLADEFGQAALATLFLAVGIGAVAGLAIQIAIMVVLRRRGRLPRLREISWQPVAQAPGSRFLNYAVWGVIAAVLIPVMYVQGGDISPEAMKHMLLLTMGVLLAIVVILALRIRSKKRKKPEPEDEFK